MTFTPIDEPQRQQVRTDLAASYLVEAGAGTGKTTLLIDRLSALAQVAGLENIAAITFTEKAAAELFARLRRTFNQQLAAADSGTARRLLEALGALDRAQVSTIHAFAAGIVREGAFELGLDPEFEHLEESDETTLLQDLLTRRLASPDPEGRTALASFVQWGGRLPDLALLIKKLHTHRDLLEFIAPSRPVSDYEAQMESLDNLVQAMIQRADEYCQDSSDYACAPVMQLPPLQSGSGGEDDMPFLQALARLSRKGNKKNWRPAEQCELQKRDIALARAQANALINDLRRFSLGEVIPWLLSLVNQLELRKLEHGRIGYQDQLLLARRLLADPTFRRRIQDRAQRVLIDEFQDTDPLQAQIAALLTAGDADIEDPICELQPRPGSLFIVGDPKQSIYRFRRADPEMYRDAAESLNKFGRAVSIVQN
ncbi:MAG: UvrD-helicase domain-containing protein, partial [Calditrichota bacterium]